MVKKEAVVLSDEEYKCFQKMTNKLNGTTIIRVGDGEGTVKEQLKRVKKSNRDLKRKVALSIQEKVELQEDIAKLRAIIGNKGNEEFEILKRMKKEIEKLRLQNSGYSGLLSEKNELQFRIDSLGKDITNFKKEVESKENQIEELKSKNEELKKEIDVRIQEDTIFHNLDL